MKRTTMMVTLAMTAVLLAGCGLAFGGRMGAGTAVTPAGGAATPTDPALANGEQIYFTGANAQGERIQYTGGPDFGGMMMGSYLTCASCHGPEGRGGLHVMHMTTMDAPAINYSALVEMKAEHGAGEAEGEHEEDTSDSGALSLDEFRQLVVEGQELDGEELDEDMPRWQLGDDDLSDLFAFLKALD
jgi:mono/diheme cytochrome c family protein